MTAQFGRTWADRMVLYVTTATGLYWCREGGSMARWMLLFKGIASSVMRPYTNIDLLACEISLVALGTYEP